MQNIDIPEKSTEQERVISLKLGKDTLVLWRKNILVNGTPSLPNEDLYRIEFNTDHKGVFSDLTLPRALMMIINILGGIAERATRESGDYAFNKEQIMAMASMYSQVDSQFLVESLQYIHDLEFQAMRLMSKD
ncbi:hypothetical protein [Aliiglaciecola sp. LCG003]|uniref:hypothetical protein n=1 Tax=Aliiglaciecola sp. LCG003 TaxID=3053655 RepID=UPI00257409C5|nr:hypothetical protein [Aliiglaciecola sp. LCG003]WJG11183.1 hypothetical protein QR722_09185 [Aliiglaciecola sp. LCG003]